MSDESKEIMEVQVDSNSPESENLEEDVEKSSEEIVCVPDTSNKNDSEPASEYMSCANSPVTILENANNISKIKTANRKIVSANKKKIPTFDYRKRRKRVTYNQGHYIQCLNCAFMGKEIINHYVKKHPGKEIPMSRFRAEDAKIVMEESEAMISGTNDPPDGILNFACRFCHFRCKGKRETYFEIIYEHCTRHTGEYRYKCNVCHYTAVSRGAISAHFYTTCNSENISYHSAIDVQKILEENLVYGYLCSSCYFVQLNKSNVEKHVKNSHNDTPVEIIKINMSLKSVECTTEGPPILENELATCSKHDETFSNCDIRNDNEDIGNESRLTTVIEKLAARVQNSESNGPYAEFEVSSPDESSSPKKEEEIPEAPNVIPIALLKKVINLNSVDGMSMQNTDANQETAVASVDPIEPMSVVKVIIDTSPQSQADEMFSSGADISEESNDDATCQLSECQSAESAEDISQPVSGTCSPTIFQKSRKRKIDFDDSWNKSEKMQCIDSAASIVLDKSNKSGKFGPFGNPANEKYMCPLCKKDKKYQTPFRHCMMDHLFRELEYVRWYCVTCKHMDVNKNGLKKHCLVRHGLIKIKPLPIIDEVEEWINDFFKHQTELIRKFNFNNSIKEGTPNIIKNNEKVDVTEADSTVTLEKTWICGWCNFQSNCGEESMIHHHRSCHSQLDFKYSLLDSLEIAKGLDCPDCDFKTKTFDLMLKHICEHIEKFQCKYCEKCFAESFHVEQHCLLVHPENETKFEIRKDYNSRIQEVMQLAVNGLSRSNETEKKNFKSVAKKSTTCLSRFPLDDKYQSSGMSHYGLKSDPIDLTTINTFVSIGGHKVQLDCKTFSHVIDINPQLNIVDINGA